MKMLIFANGYDAPGIGAAITKILFEKDCKIDNFKINTLDNHFFLMVSAECKQYLDQSEVEECIKEEVKPFSVDIKVLNIPLSHEANIQQEEWIPYKINIICEEQTGILYSLMKNMSLLKINIADVRCLKHGSDKEKTYQIITKIEVPLKISQEILKSTLDELAGTFNVMIDISPIESLEL